ncbi:MAG: TetR/AcrR family transcriptional regulator [Bacillota bacterium]|nr:TetR/AcrR family transcriptional regulator [Bacillota bacterium]
MAQFAKDEIRQRIIDIAREEFLEKGFEKASIRTITAKAKTSKSNLYNYFNDKNDLFCSALELTITKIRKGLELAKQFNVPKDADEYTLKSQVFVVGAINRFVAENLADVKLLLFKSQGTSLESFKYEVLEVFTDNMYEWAKSIRTNREISKLFVRSICSFYLSLIEQAILYGNSAEMEEFQKQSTSFIYNGWRGIFKESNE